MGWIDAIKVREASACGDESAVAAHVEGGLHIVGRCPLRTEPGDEEQGVGETLPQRPERGRDGSPDDGAEQTVPVRIDAEIARTFGEEVRDAIRNRDRGSKVRSVEGKIL